MRNRMQQGGRRGRGRPGRDGLRAALIACALIALTGTARAGREIRETRPATPDGTVAIELIAGSLAIEGWTRREVSVEGTLGRGTRGLRFEASDRRVEIRVEIGDREDVEGSDLIIRIPAGSRLEVQAIGADVEGSGLDGEIRIETVAGDIGLEGGRSKALSLETISGDITVLTSARLREGRFKSVVGDIEVELDLDRGARLDLEAISGDISLALPGRVSADFEVSTFSGSIASDLGGQVRRRADHAPGRELRFATGGGDARVRIESLSGDVEITTR